MPRPPRPNSCSIRLGSTMSGVDGAQSAGSRLCSANFGLDSAKCGGGSAKFGVGSAHGPSSSNFGRGATKFGLGCAQIGVGSTHFWPGSAECRPASTDLGPVDEIWLGSPELGTRLAKICPQIGRICHHIWPKPARLGSHPHSSGQTQIWSKRALTLPWTKQLLVGSKPTADRSKSRRNHSNQPAMLYCVRPDGQIPGTNRNEPDRSTFRVATIVHICTELRTLQALIGDSGDATHPLGQGKFGVLPCLWETPHGMGRPQVQDQLVLPRYWSVSPPLSGRPLRTATGGNIQWRSSVRNLCPLVSQTCAIALSS